MFSIHKLYNQENNIHEYYKVNKLNVINENFADCLSKTRDTFLTAQEKKDHTEMRY